MWKHKKNFINLQLCARVSPPAPAQITINWDNNITSVVGKNMFNGTTGDVTFTNGEEVIASSYDGTDYTFEVTLNSGYVLDTVTLSSSDTKCGVLKSQTDTSFVITAGSSGISQTITITSKSSVQKLPTPTNVSITGTTVQWDEVANATSYDVLVDGEVWENVPQPITSETWVLNNTLTLENIPLYNIPFTSGGQSYEGMEVSIDSGGSGYVRYSKDGLQYGSYEEVYTKDGPMDGWNNSKWRTIVYPAPVTDVTLLPWLQANGTKQ